MKRDSHQIARQQSRHRDDDPLLAAAMCRHGLSIAEEAVADGLIEDLQAT